VTPAALALAVVTATRSSAGLAIILICGMLPRVALLPFAGVVVDRAGARLTALASDVVAGLAQLAIGLRGQPMRLVSLGGQLLGYAVGPTLTRVAGFTWPLSAAAALVVVTLLVPASLPSVRGVRLALER
jgi:hypothetical protein